MLACVDGTGPTDSAEYQSAFSRSFVTEIYNSSSHLHKFYHRGPGDTVGQGFFGLLGGSTYVSPEYVARKVERRLQLSRVLVERHTGLRAMHATARASMHRPSGQARFAWSDERQFKVYMVGYSRGGAIVVNAARILARRGWGIEAMFLFDAVDRSVVLEAAQVSSNVRTCYHAMRRVEGGSRRTFGNCATSIESPGMLFSERFYTTHGGMGGTPWGPRGAPGQFIVEGAESWVLSSTAITPALEARYMAAVRAWMWRYLRQHNVVP